ncbi:MAG TPA: hypothetical protein DDX54_06440 [Rhodospirillaceae bacterium]|jgi:Flp pilus assembly protein TadG|nr:hypothetical protein [Rhodospirillaceae bacterium]
MTHFLRRFWADTTGAFAIMFALTLPVLMLVLGASIDFALVTLEKQKLQATLDSATLAALSQGMGPDDPAFKEDLIKYFSARTDRTFNANDITVSVSGASVVVQVQSAVDTFFLGDFVSADFETIELTVETGVLGDSNLDSLEVVFAVDVSHLMRPYMDTLRDGTVRTLNALEDLATENIGLDVKVGLVPWSTGVVLDPYGLGRDLDGNAYGEAFLMPHRDADWGPGERFADYYAMYSVLPYRPRDYYTCAAQEWGCLFPNQSQKMQNPLRSGGVFMHWTPGNSVGLAYEAWSDELRMRKCRCSFWFDGRGNTCQCGARALPGTSYVCTDLPARHIIAQSAYDYTAQSDASKWPSLPSDPDRGSDSSHRTGWFIRAIAEQYLPYNYEADPRSAARYTDPYGDALIPFGNPLIPLTDDYAMLREQVENWVAAGRANGAEGLLWAYRVLSPADPFEEGADFGDDDARKVVVLIMDGMMEDSDASNPAKNAAREKKMCDALKDQGVFIYTVLRRTTDPRLVYFCKTVIPADPPEIVDDPNLGTGRTEDLVTWEECAAFSPLWTEARKKDMNLTGEWLSYEFVDIAIATTQDLAQHCAGKKDLEDNAAYQFTFEDEGDLDRALTNVSAQITNLRIAR